VKELVLVGGRVWGDVWKGGRGMKEKKREEEGEGSVKWIFFGKSAR